jgi:hypothetical protein
MKESAKCLTSGRFPMKNRDRPDTDVALMSRRETSEPRTDIDLVQLVNNAG